MSAAAEHAILVVIGKQTNFISLRVFSLLLFAAFLEEEDE
jgi:hypothetical protein